MGADFFIASAIELCGILMKLRNLPFARLVLTALDRLFFGSLCLSFSVTSGRFEVLSAKICQAIEFSHVKDLQTCIFKHQCNGSFG